jgi:hypothetical protein
MAFLTQNKAKLCKILIITLVFEKNANFFAENCQKSQKIVIITSVPGRPDWAIFGLLGDYFFRVYLLKITQVDQSCGLLIFKVKVLTKSALGYVLGAYFTNSSGHTECRDADAIKAHSRHVRNDVV